VDYLPLISNKNSLCIFAALQDTERNRPASLVVALPSVEGYKLRSYSLWRFWGHVAVMW